jgi:subtilisin family serine protease
MAKYNITFDPTKKAEVLSALDAVGAKIHKDHSNLNVLSVNAKNMAQLREIAGVELVETDKTISVVPAADWHQFRLVSTAMPMVAEYTPQFLGEGVEVYLVDTGINRDHTEFALANSEGRIVDLYSNDGTFNDLVGHGTGLASLIIGETIGVAPKATIKNVKIPFGDVVISDILSALNAVLADATQTPTVKVVNCSWIIPKSEILDTKITELQFSNLVVVAAAGNLIQPADNYSPVGLDTVIGVGASDAYDRVVEWVEGNGSNYGPEVDIFAPGVEVAVAGTTGLHEVSGTSVSAAIVSGVVTHLIQEHPEMSAAEIQYTLLLQGQRDVLIRDESIYETTPNVLVHTKYIGYVNAWTQPGDILVKKGETIQYTLQPCELLANAEILDYYDSPKFPYTLPNWITLERNVLTISPTAQVEPKKYMGAVSAIDPYGVIRPLFIVFGVYENEPAELEWFTENYRVQYDENDVVYLRLSTCNAIAMCNDEALRIDCYALKGGTGGDVPCTCAIPEPCHESYQ